MDSLTDKGSVSGVDSGFEVDEVVYDNFFAPATARATALWKKFIGTSFPVGGGVVLYTASCEAEADKLLDKCAKSGGWCFSIPFTDGSEFVFHLPKGGKPKFARPHLRELSETLREKGHATEADDLAQAATELHKYKAA